MICVTKILEVKMPAYTSLISDVHKFYGVIGTKRNFIAHAFAI